MHDVIDGGCYAVDIIYVLFSYSNAWEIYL